MKTPWSQYICRIRSLDKTTPSPANCNIELLLMTDSGRTVWHNVVIQVVVITKSNFPKITVFMVHPLWEWFNLHVYWMRRHNNSTLIQRIKNGEIPNYIAISACKAASSSSSVLLAAGRLDCWPAGTRTGAVLGAVVVGASSSASNSSPSKSASSASSSS
jgi:hypothetical protein